MPFIELLGFRQV